MAIALVAAYPVYNAANTATTLTTPAFTPSNGEIVVIKLSTWDTATAMGAPTGGSQIYTSRIIAAPAGFFPWVGIYTASISGSPVSMTVSSTPAATSYHSMVVERWSGAQLAVTPAVNGTISGTASAPSATLTSTGTGSIVSWVSGDSQSRDPATRAYLSAATEDGLLNGFVGANGVTYHAYQTAASPGTQTMGLSAPGAQSWALAGIEIQAAAVAAPSFTGWGVPIT